MRVVECSECGQAISADSEEALSGAVRRHFDDEHPQADLDEGAVRDLVEQSHEAADG